MVDQGILGGLKHALSKGESLKQAMMSFYNAGYKKEDIEEAAKALQQQGMSKKIAPEKPVQQLKKPEKKLTPIKKSLQRVSAYGKVAKPKVKLKEKPKPEKRKPKQIEQPVKTKSPQTSPQRVSSYEGKPKGKLVLILLISFLLFLIATLFAVIFFRKELIEFFNQLS